MLFNVPSSLQTCMIFIKKTQNKSFIRHSTLPSKPTRSAMPPASAKRGSRSNLMLPSICFWSGYELLVLLKLCAIGNNLTQLGSHPAHHHTNIPGVVFVLFTYVVLPDDISPQHFGRCTLSHRNGYLVFSSLPACVFVYRLHDAPPRCAALGLSIGQLLTSSLPQLEIRHTSTPLLKTPLRRSTIPSSPAMSVPLRPPMVLLAFLTFPGDLGAVLNNPSVLALLPCHTQPSQLLPFLLVTLSMITPVCRWRTTLRLSQRKTTS